jgi:opacity protein-like surface antigen
MKKLILFIVVIAVAGTASAQLTKGSIWLGTDLSFSTENSETESTAGSTTVITDETKRSSFGIMPNVQYFIADDLAVVLGVGYNTNSSTYEDKSDNRTTESSNSGFSLNVGAYKYFGGESRVKPFAGIMIGVNPNSGTTEFTDNSNNTTTKTENEAKNFMANLHGGVAFLATDKLLINANLALLGYSSNETTDKSGNSSTTTSSSGIDMYLNSNDFLLAVGFAWRLN